MTSRSRRTSRGTASDRMQSVEHIYNTGQRHNHLEDVEHKRVIDNFVVRNKILKAQKKQSNFVIYLVGFSF